MVMRLPSRSRATSLPSLTARRPKVDSAMSAWRQNSEIWARIWSFFIGAEGWTAVGSGKLRRVPTTSCPSGRPHILYRPGTLDPRNDDLIDCGVDFMHRLLVA